MGNRYGFFTIYVEPIDKNKDNSVVKLVRRFEDKILPFFSGRKASDHSLVHEMSDLIKVRDK